MPNNQREDREAGLVTEIESGSPLVLDLIVGPMHVAGRALAPLGEDPSVWWVNVNMRGTHLPQTFRITECHPLEAEGAAFHGFCVKCLGFGFDGETLCGQCLGSGRPGFSVFAMESQTVTEAIVDIDLTVMEAIRCDVCRAATTPQPR